MQSRDGNTQVSKQYLTYPFNTPIEYNSDQSGNFGQYSLVDKSYVDNLVGSFDTKRLISGAVEYTGFGNSFSTTTLEYTFGSGVQTLSPTYVALTNGDPTYDRIDAIVVLDIGSVSVIPGTPAPTPATPTITEDAILLQYVVVPTGATVSDITFEDIYKENTEWDPSIFTAASAPTFSYFASLGATVSFTNTNQVYEGNYSMYIKSNPRSTSTQSFSINLRKPFGLISPSDYGYLSMRVKLEQALPSPYTIYFKWGRNYLSQQAGIGWSLPLTNYGLQRTNTTNWQNIVIPMVAFQIQPLPPNSGGLTYSSDLINELNISLSGGYTTSQYGVWYDDIKLQTGISPVIDANPVGISKGGTAIGSRPRLNFIEGSNISIGVTDDPFLERVNVSISTPGSAGVAGQFQLSNGLGAFSELGLYDPDNLNLYVNDSPSTGTNNTIIGIQAGIANTTGTQNVFVGGGSGNLNSVGSYNTFIGGSSGNLNTSGNCNTFIGYDSGNKNDIGISNTFIGFSSGKCNVSGSCNVFIGHCSGFANLTSGNTFIGFNSGLSNTTGYFNTFIGLQTGNSNVVGRCNVFIGHMTGFSNSSGQSNVFIGLRTGYSNTTGESNVYIGQSSGAANMSGKNNVFIGHLSGCQSTASDGSVIIGFRAGEQNDADANTFIGCFSGFSNTTGVNNVFLGACTGFNNSSGACNTFIGRGSGTAMTKGCENTFIGSSAGNIMVTGNRNTFIGTNANVIVGSEGITSSIAIGYGATASVSGDFVIGSALATLNTTSTATSISTYLCVKVNGQEYRIPLYT